MNSKLKGRLIVEKLIELMFFVIVLSMDVCVLIAAVWASIWMILWIQTKLNQKKKQGPITAVLYDSKVENVVDIVVIDKGIRDYSEPIYETTTGMKYHFFCIQDDGKHIFIERG